MSHHAHAHGQGRGNTPDDAGDRMSRRRKGDQIVQATLLVFFALSAFAMNPVGWGVFDWMVMGAIVLLLIWTIVRSYL